MGGFSDQPYIYEPQNRRVAYPYSDFNPKAVTQASYQKLAAQESPDRKKKEHGPLVNFNQHPDSYMIVAGQNVDWKPMSPNTKKKVTILRWMQFALRIMEEIGALGMLTAVICIKGMVTSMAWITRIAPAWDAVITIYAIYHLARSPKARPPMSSASYHMFAIFMDVGLIPFYVFIAIFANNNYWMPTKDEQRWTSFFTADGATDTLLAVTWVGAIVVAGLHAASTFFDLWLVILFRKIAKLPPDQNPLEDNLTSRKASKHKYKNSEATLTGSFDEKNTKFLSGSTLNVDDQSRLSTAIKEAPESRQVPFKHSRTGSELGYSPHNPDSVRWSQQQVEGGLYQQSPSARGSMASVRPHTRGNSISPPKTGSFAITETPPTPTRSPRPVSFPNNGESRGTFNSNRFSTPMHPNAAPTDALVKSQQQKSLLSNSNWVTLDDDDDAADLGNPDRAGYDENSRIDRHDFQPQPLKMNPPTPPPGQGRYYASDRSALTPRSDNGNANLERHLTVLSNATGTSSVYSESSPSLQNSKNLSPGTPKSKHYGDLAAATLGVRGGTSKSTERLHSNGTVGASESDATGMSALGSYGFCPSPPPKVPKINRDRKGRVVSRTGVDLANASQDMVNFAKGQSRRREVSGKVAEEGRGGGGSGLGWKGYR